MQNSTKPKDLLRRLKKTLTTLNRESNALVASYQKRGGLTQNKMKRYQDLQHFRAILEGVERLVKEKNKKALLAMFGEHLEFLPLLFHCLYSSPFGSNRWHPAMVGEQSMKRGTSNYFDKTYSVEFCPFRTLTQFSNQTDTWRKRNDQ